MFTGIATMNFQIDKYLFLFFEGAFEIICLFVRSVRGKDSYKNICIKFNVFNVSVYKVNNFTHFV